MGNKAYRSMESRFDVNRRDLMKLGGAAAAGLMLGTPALWAQEKGAPPPPRPSTNIQDALKTPRTAQSIPGPFPGRVIQVRNAGAMKGDVPDAGVVRGMFERGMKELTGGDLKKSFNLLFKRDDTIGIKISPAGGLMQSSRPEVVEAVVEWLRENGVPGKNIILWDRFDSMLKDAGFTSARFPGIGLEGLQTMDDEAAEGKTTDNSRWLGKDGKHVSLPQFDSDVYYWADVDGPPDLPYLNQHVVNGKYSYFGKLVTQRLTKIINLPVFKNTGNGISMATKNLGYGAICNTGRLHQPLFFDVCAEVLAFAPIRDKYVLTINDGLRGQYDGGPMPAPQFTYAYNTLFFATDPIACDFVGHTLMVEKRKAMGVKIVEHPRYTDYLRYAEKLGLGTADPKRIQLVRA